MENLENKDNGELILKYYNACVRQDEEAKEAIRDEMESRSWTVYQSDPQHNPTWHDYNVPGKNAK